MLDEKAATSAYSTGYATTDSAKDYARSFNLALSLGSAIIKPGLLMFNGIFVENDSEIVLGPFDDDGVIFPSIHINFKSRTVTLELLKVPSISYNNLPSTTDEEAYIRLGIVVVKDGSVSESYGQIALSYNGNKAIGYGRVPSSASIIDTIRLSRPYNTGMMTGNGNPRTILFGYRPTLVVVSQRDSDETPPLFIYTSDQNAEQGYTTATGVMVKGAKYIKQGVAYDYIAFR